MFGILFKLFIEGICDLWFESIPNIAIFYEIPAFDFWGQNFIIIGTKIIINANNGTIETTIIHFVFHF